MRSLLRVPVPARDRPEASPASSVLTAEPAQALLSRTGEQRDRFPPPLALPIFSPVDVDALRSAEQRVQWVYGARSAAESRRRYDQWAPQYEQDLVDTYGYRLPDTIAEDFTRWVTPPATVLDAGVGTGLVGACLADLGFRDLVGLDNSPAMLAETARKGIYRALHEMTLGQPLGFESAIFDAVISAGTFTEGHAPASGLRELARVTRPGGHMVVGIRPDIIESHGFAEIIDELAATRVWVVVDRTEPRVAIEKLESYVLVETWCFRIL